MKKPPNHAKQDAKQRVVQRNVTRSSAIIFFGTPDYVIPVLDALKNAGYDIAAVVCQPPKPIGRHGIAEPSPVAQWADKFNIQVIDKRPKDCVEEIRKIGAPVAVLEAYGRLIPQELINAFPKGIINVHPSLLPKYRGASPVEGALVSGDQETGVTILKLDADLDHGPILSQFTETILPEDNRVTLRKRLFDKAASVLPEILQEYLDGKTKLKEQDHDKATFTTLMKKEMGFIPPEYVAAATKGDALQGKKWPIPFVKGLTIHPSPITIHRFIRAVNPWPGAFTNVKLMVNGQWLTKRLKILEAHLELLTINHYSLIIDRVQLEGKNPVSWKQFKEGYPATTF
ncbi:methionyl-tRNA formyltransferase [Candidatus Microgenomates bacterium]|nr:methionyl-tRNA formyltransferase [Candidatus Microgenomates bacterium]